MNVLSLNDFVNLLVLVFNCIFLVLIQQLYGRYNDLVPLLNQLFDFFLTYRIGQIVFFKLKGSFSAFVRNLHLQ